MWRSSLWSISWLSHQMFYPHITISAAQAPNSDDLHHAISPFSLFLSSFSGSQRILGYVRPRRIVEVHPPRIGRRRSLWRSLQTGTDFRCSSEGCRPELRHSTCCSNVPTHECWKNDFRGARECSVKLYLWCVYEQLVQIPLILPLT